MISCSVPEFEAKYSSLYEAICKGTDLSSNIEEVNVIISESIRLKDPQALKDLDSFRDRIAHILFDKLEKTEMMNNYVAIKEFASIQTNSRNISVPCALNTFGLLLGLANDITLSSLIPLVQKLLLKLNNLPENLEFGPFHKVFNHVSGSLVLISIKKNPRTREIVTNLLNALIKSRDKNIQDELFYSLYWFISKSSLKLSEDSYMSLFDKLLKVTNNIPLNIFNQILEASFDLIEHVEEYRSVFDLLLIFTLDKYLISKLDHEKFNIFYFALFHQLSKLLPKEFKEIVNELPSESKEKIEIYLNEQKQMTKLEICYKSLLKLTCHNAPDMAFKLGYSSIKNLKLIQKESPHLLRFLPTNFLNQLRFICTRIIFNHRRESVEISELILKIGYEIAFFDFDYSPKSQLHESCFSFALSVGGLIELSKISIIKYPTDQINDLKPHFEDLADPLIEVFTSSTKPIRELDALAVLTFTDLIETELNYSNYRLTKTILSHFIAITPEEEEDIYTIITAWNHKLDSTVLSNSFFKMVTSDVPFERIKTFYKFIKDSKGFSKTELEILKKFEKKKFVLL